MKSNRFLEYLTNTVRRVILLMAGAPDTDSGERWSSNAFAGGVLNYRTETLDDGTDPLGWYEDD